MGLLDDAIREHLDLKRRRGADPAEVERAEREALGPVRREPFEPGGDELEPAGGAAASDPEEGLFDHEQYGEERYADQQYGEEPYADEGDWGDAFEDEPEPAPPVSAAGAGGADEATRVMAPAQLEDELSVGSEETQREAPAPYSAEPVGDETVQYNVDEAFAAETDTGATSPPGGSPPLDPQEDLEPQDGPEKKQGDDVLEETPDFLQDAPDHDRLWFEQRPPRDFDFDG